VLKYFPKLFSDEERFEWAMILSADDYTWVQGRAISVLADYMSGSSMERRKRVERRLTEIAEATLSRHAPDPRKNDFGVRPAFSALEAFAKAKPPHPEFERIALKILRRSTAKPAVAQDIAWRLCCEIRIQNEELLLELADASIPNGFTRDLLEASKPLPKSVTDRIREVDAKTTSD
jgi:hypothetical protein